MNPFNKSTETINVKVPGNMLGVKIKDAFGLIIKLGCMGLVLALLALFFSLGTNLQPGFVDYLIVMALGTMVGFVEIISRYQDAPFPTALTWPGIFYMWINALVAAAALWGIRLFGWNFIPSQTASADVTRWTQVITAGLGAMAIFRSSLFVLGKEEDAVSVGPNAVLQILLTAIDKEVDRYRGQERAKTVRRLMGKVNFDNASVMIGNLVDIVKYLMQNLGEDDKKKIDDLKAVEGKVLLGGADTELKKYLLGLQMMDLVGENVLQDAITIITDVAEKSRLTDSAKLEKPEASAPDKTNEDPSSTPPWASLLNQIPNEGSSVEQPGLNTPETLPAADAPSSEPPKNGSDLKTDGEGFG